MNGVFMKRLLFLLVIMFVYSDFIMAQTYTPPSGYTSFYRLRMWAQGAKPGADSLNRNWKDIDSILYHLVVNADPRYFKWKDANHDTLSLNLTSFGTLGFADGENLFLPFHTSPYTLLGTNAIANTTGGYVIFKWSSRIDTMLTNYQYRTYKNGSETINGNKIHNGTNTYNNTTTYNLSPNLYTWKTIWNWQKSVPSDTVNGKTYPTSIDSVRWLVKGVANTLDTTGVVFSGSFLKTPSDVQFRFMSRILFNGTYAADYDSVKCLIKIEAKDTDGVPFIGGAPVKVAI